MSIFQNIAKAIRNPTLFLVFLLKKRPFRYVSDVRFIKLYFYAYHKKKINLDNPRTFNEKLQWLKLYYKEPILSDLVDKYKVRSYVKERIGEQYLVKLLGVWDNAKEIDFDALPNRFVLKCNHDSGSVIICRKKSDLNIKKTIRSLNKHLNRNQFWEGREYAYRYVKPRIIAEEYLSDDDSDELTDFKIFCFDGQPKFISTDKGRFSNHIRNYYSLDWVFIDASYGCKNDSVHLDAKPKQLEEMIELARKLSKGFPHVRVDFYISNNRIYFGELTFYHGGGAMILKPYEYDELWGNYLKLPDKKI